MLKMKVKVDAKIESALEQMHFGRIQNNLKVKWLHKLLLDHPLFFATYHDGKVKLLSP